MNDPEVKQSVLRVIEKLLDREKLTSFDVERDVSELWDDGDLKNYIARDLTLTLVFRPMRETENAA